VARGAGDAGATLVALDVALGPAGRLESEGTLVWPPGVTERPPVSHVSHR
jgi:hypothetical protein